MSWKTPEEELPNNKERVIVITKANEIHILTFRDYYSHNPDNETWSFDLRGNDNELKTSAIYKWLSLDKLPVPKLSDELLEELHKNEMETLKQVCEMLGKSLRETEGKIQLPNLIHNFPKVKLPTHGATLRMRRYKEPIK